MNTKIDSTYINFGQQIPTYALLQSALRNADFCAWKNLSQACGVTYSGHISFYRRAIKIADDAMAHDNMLRQFVQRIKNLDKSSQDAEIKNFISKYGEFLDITI